MGASSTAVRALARPGLNQARDEAEFQRLRPPKDTEAIVLHPQAIVDVGNNLFQHNSPVGL